MGLFSGKTIVSVASALYNLAGDEKDRPIFLQNLIIRNVLSGTKRSLGDTITSGYLQSPGIKFSTFFRWALDNYTLVGMPTGEMYAGDTISSHVVGDEIPVGVDELAWVQSATLGDSDYEKWAERYMLANHADIFDTAWEADFDDETKTVNIKFDPAGPVMPDEDFVATNFTAGAKYIFAYYTVTKSDDEEAPVLGTPVVLGSSAFPSVSGYYLDSTSTANRTESLSIVTTVTKSYSDGRPDEVTVTPSTSTPLVTKTIDVYFKDTFIGNVPGTDSRRINRDIRRLTTDEKVVTDSTSNTVTDTIAGGVIRTTVTDVNGDMLAQNNSYRDDTQVIIQKAWKPLALFIYKIGSGNAVLDGLVNLVADYGKFFPMIPFRINNKFVSELAEADVDGASPHWNTIYEQCKKAFRKGTYGGKYSKVQASLAENDDIGDMDYIYAVYGVSLNCLDKSARRYIFDFFERLRLDQMGGPTVETDFVTQMADYKIAYDIWLDWKQSGSSDPEPLLPAKPTLPSNEIKIQSVGAGGTTDVNYNVHILWNYIIRSEDTVGIGQPGAEKNDIWIQYRGKTTIIDPIYTGENSYDGSGLGGTGVKSNNVIEYETIRIWWQFEDNQYRYLDIAGLVHKNFIYDGKNVTITAKEALIDGDESGFFIPLHYATFRELPLIHRTQVSTACVFLVINCYATKKTKWWQSWFFQIIFVIVIAIISVVFTGGAGLGLLGTNLSVGSALGLTGVGAAIAGSVANALAALVLTTIIQKVTQDMGVLGPILGAIIGIILGGAIQSLTSGGGFTFNFSDLMRADNIMKLMDAAGKGYSVYVQDSINGMQKDLIKLQEDANAELRRIREQYVSQFGYGGGQIDPMMFTSIDNPAMTIERRDVFLSRTLMTGSDIANMSMDLLNNMADLTLTLPNAFTE